MSVGVLVVDDQPLFRGAAREVIEATPEFGFLGEAVSGEQAVVAAAELAPDLALVTVRMQGLDGVETCRLLRASHPDTVVVLLSLDDILCLPAEVGFCGAVDVVQKQDLQPALLRRIWNSYGRRRLA